MAAYFSPFETGAMWLVQFAILLIAAGCMTHGWVPFTDVGPPFHKQLMPNLAVGGPLARSIDDLELVLSVITAQSEVAKLKPKLKIAFSLHWMNVWPDAKSEHTIRLLIDQVREQGHNLTEITPQLDFGYCTEVYGIILDYEFNNYCPLFFDLGHSCGYSTTSSIPTGFTRARSKKLSRKACSVIAPYTSRL